MRVKNRWIKLLAVILLLGMMLPVNIVANASTEDAETRVIKVFYPLQFGFTQVNEDGIYSGYTYEYLIKLAQMTGWRYEFVVMDATNENLIDGIARVRDGDIHLMGGVVYSEELESDYTFSAEPYGETRFSLVCREDNEQLNERTLRDYPELKVAIIKGAKVQNNLFDDYCKEKGLDYQAVYVETNNDCRDMISSGMVDAMISKDAIEGIGLKTIVNFAPQPFYLATSKENSELMGEIDKVMEAINIANPDFASKLHKKHFTKPSDYNIALSAEERDYVETAGTIAVIVPTNRAPIQDYDAKTGKFSGIVIDILGIIEEKSGLDFELIPAETPEQVWQLLEQNQDCIIAGVTSFYRSIDDLNMSNTLMTSPILTSPVVRISNVAGSARQEETLVSKSIIGFEAKENIKYIEDIKEVFALVDSGEYQEAYVNGYMAQYYMDTRYNRNVTAALIPNSSYQLCIAVKRQSDLRLMGILEQAIAAIMPSEVEDIVYLNTRHNYRLDLGDVIKKNPTPFFATAVIVLTVILALLLLLVIRTRRLNKLVSAEKNRYKEISQMDQMTQTYNNEAFKKLVQYYLEREDKPPCGALIVCDIDNFKSINDSFGHWMGDQVLHRLGQLILTVFRKDDLAGRLGGDEFVVLMKDLEDWSIVEKRCEELLQRCTTINEECSITLSIGVATFSQASTFEELFKSADAALYEIKNNGKNGYKIFS